MRTPLLVALLLTSGFASAADQARALPPFTSVSSEGALNIVVQVGKAQTVVLRGDEKYLAKVQTRVVNGELVVNFPREKKNQMEVSSDNKIFISVPTLKAFHCLHWTRNFSLSRRSTRSTPPSGPCPPRSVTS